MAVYCDACGTTCNPENHLFASGQRREAEHRFLPNEWNPTMLMLATQDDPFSDIEPPAAKAPVQTPTPSELRGRTVYFDLETVPDESRLDLFDLDPLPIALAEGTIEECPPASGALSGSIDAFRAMLEKFWPCDEWLDIALQLEQSAAKPRAGIASAIASFRERKASVANAEVERRKLLSVTPEYCRVVAFAWAVGDSPAFPLVVGVNGVTETTILETFWSIAKHAKRVCGFNVLGFDLPVVFVRSALLDVQPTRQFDTKPWGGDVADLMKVRFPSGRAMGLKSLAKCMGIPVPAGDVEGSQVFELFKTDPAKLAEYVASDVEITRQLHRRYAGYFCP